MSKTFITTLIIGNIAYFSVRSNARGFCILKDILQQQHSHFSSPLSGTIITSCDTFEPPNISNLLSKHHIVMDRMNGMEGMEGMNSMRLGLGEVPPVGIRSWMEGL